MEAFHVVTGVPRSGSTLLCNLLNQNPDIHASSTSPLAPTLGGVANYWTSAPEIKSELAHDAEEAEARMLAALRGMVSGWYSQRSENVVFDKGRGWIALADRLGALYPDARMLCCVRDPRDVFASVQRQHLRFPVLDEHAQTPIVEKAGAMFAPAGIIGGPLTHIEDQISRRSLAVVPVIFERLVADPERELRKVYAECLLDWWSGHDFENVANVATDLDALYLGKFPHDASGKVEPPAHRWDDVVPPELATQIVGRYPIFCRFFGYS